MVTLNARGECVDIQEADQMQPAKSQFECGFFACAMARSMAKPGQPPTLSVQQIINNAEAWYAQYDGSDAISNMDGMTLDQEYSLLQQIGLHYQSIAVNVDAVRTWVRAGYPVIVAVYETSVFDLGLGNVNPYPWSPAGSHVILITGVTSDGNLLVRDSANCTNLYDPNSLRPGPRKYNANALQLVSATAVVPPWMPRPSNGTTPPVVQEDTMFSNIQLSDVKGYFEDVGGGAWYCIPKKVKMGGAILKYYVSHFGPAIHGLPNFNEAKLYPNDKDPKKAVIAFQFCEHTIIVFDPYGILDRPWKLTGDPEPRCYTARIDSGYGQQLVAQALVAPLQSQVKQLLAIAQNDASQAAQLQSQIAQKEAEITQLQAQLAAASGDKYLTALKQIGTLVVDTVGN